MINAVQATLYFDGDCNFCVACADFVKRHDRHNRISLVILQDSEYQDENHCYESILFIKDQKQTQFSSAVVSVLKTMGGLWFVLGFLLWLVPRPLRDWVYRFVGQRRHWFGGSRPIC